MANKEPFYAVTVYDSIENNQLKLAASFIVHNFAQDGLQSRHEQIMEIAPQLIDPLKPASEQPIITRRIPRKEVKSVLKQCKDPEEVTNGLVVQEQYKPGEQFWGVVSMIYSDQVAFNS